MRLSNDRIVISLRPEQRETLARVRQRTFVLHLRDRVRSSFPAATGAIDDARLLDLVSARVEQARSLGFSRQSAIADFVGLSFDVGDGFHRHRLVGRILADTGVPADLRLRRLFERLSSDQWRRVRRDMARMASR
ncbi:MAG TPA: hypothetical protein VK943_14750 [Arenibaculum sp.]|nr:hypothetical protein [Arenibaculum sp.]